METQRKLAAVMFTDIVGYTALMSKDEQKALSVLQKNKEIQIQLVEKHNGEFLKEMGDGTLLCFQSAFDAVQCAQEIQQSVSDDPDLNLRIGIHLGDIVFKEGDIYGDGVNVASRIEQLADAGGIFISGQVYTTIKNKPGIETVFIGEKQLKNVDGPVSIYALTGEGLPETSNETLKAEQKADRDVSGFSSRRRKLVFGIVLWIIAGAIGLAALMFTLIYFLEKGNKEHPFEQMQITRLTSHGKAKEAAISPDGKYIVHVMEKAGKESLWLRQLATNSDIQILSPTNIQVSGLIITPDGNYIYYLVQEKNLITNNLYRLPILGGTPVEVLKNVDSPITFSPDGKKFTFIRFDPFPTDNMIMLANSDGSDIKVLANQRLPEVFGSLSSPAWSPDGKMIVHAQILGIDKKYTLIAIDIHNGAIKQLCPQKWLSINSIDWLDDGSGLFLVSRSQTSNYQIWYLSYPGRELKRITTDLNNYRGVSLTADGGSLITVLSEQNSSIWMSYLGNEDNAKQITQGRYDGQRGITWLPDGKILHASRDYKLWLINSDGTNAQRLTPDDRRDFSPSVSPDGQTIFFTTVRGSILELWKMNVDGTKAVQIAPLSAYPRCAPNGDWIVYGSVVDDKFAIMKMSIKDGDIFQLTDKSAYGPDISPDGNKIACYLGNESQPDKLTIAVFPFEGGEPELIFDFPNDVLPSSFLHWTPDGSAITYIAEQGGISNIWSQPLDGSPSKQISNFKEKLIFAFDWSNDGSLVFSSGTIDNDVVLIKDIK